MPQLLRRTRPWMLALAACALVACTEEPDVVGYPLQLEGGAPSDAAADADVDAASSDACEPRNRFRRARLPEQLVLDIYMMDCSIPLQSFMPRSGESTLSAAEFSALLRAEQITPPPGLSAALFCDPERGGYYFEPLDRPQRLVLCPATCERVKDEIERVLSLDGCDPSFDDAGTSQR